MLWCWEMSKWILLQQRSKENKPAIMNLVMILLFISLLSFSYYSLSIVLSFSSLFSSLFTRHNFIWMLEYGKVTFRPKLHRNSIVIILIVLIDHLNKRFQSVAMKDKVWPIFILKPVQQCLIKLWKILLLDFFLRGMALWRDVDMF